MATITRRPRLPDIRSMPAVIKDQWPDFARWLTATDLWLADLERIMGANDGDFGDFETRVDAAETDIDALEAGRVAGPGSAVDNRIARFDGNTGKLIKNSAAELTDAGDITGVGVFDATAGFTVNGVVVLLEPGAAIADALTGGGATAANCAAVINAILATMRAAQPTIET